MKSIITLLMLMLAMGYLGYNCYKNNGLEFRVVAKKFEDFTYNIHGLGYLYCQGQESLKGLSLDLCLISPKGKITAAVLGDSHAEDKFHGITNLDESRNWMLIGNTSCPPVYGITVEVDQKDCQKNQKV